jgi:hypothetical protein
MSMVLPEAPREAFDREDFISFEWRPDPISDDERPDDEEDDEPIPFMPLRH